MKEPHGGTAAPRTADPDASVRMPHSAAVDLLAPVLHHVAAANGIRVLSIKGSVLSEQGLREPRQPSDVDILVDPLRFDDLVVLLRAAGWMDRDRKVLVPLPASGTVLAPHARTLEHPNWPCQLDLHRYYPGFLRSAAAVFDHLWGARVIVEIAHAGCGVPAPPDHWILAALHALRSGDDDQLSELEVAAARVFAGRQSALLARAEVLGAVGPLGDSLERLTGLRPEVPESEQELLTAWQRRIADPESLPEAFIEQFRAARGLTRLQFAARQAWPTPRSARAFHDVGPGPLGLARFYIARLAVAPTKLAGYLGLHGRGRVKRRR
ncbi:nucleotidyltransferase family protein [Microbacterium enclense]|uniref:nucleotidyltransferase family protein n=1 Tax=Microbacterium enclense TaxID=993073 RepID=UPI003D73C2FF